jgi:membrane protein involved in colicin uptake
MKKRYLILGLSVVLALALAVPAFGGPTNPISKSLASVKKTANKALKTAKNAQTTANSALSAAESAQNTASKANTEIGKSNTEIKKLGTSVTTAQSTADAAKLAAAGAQASANSAKATADAAAAAAAAAEANANTRLKGSTELFSATSVSSEANKFATIECAEGSPTLGGGYELGGASNKVGVFVSEKALYGEGWFVGGQLINGQTGNWTIRAVAICGTK